ncbi:hydroxymethylglutaryl-CoA lyase [Halobacteriovorax sp. XZX-3]|uniref:hydroxymethylglutaryl-CoA lyase n=1 Tax=unclassified Halobacteriovorax TaxID=2639665 RepID=UPI000CD17930|nr:hydroxymethylglutaryl-CoA lyase [Halobacteriovorax sp. DA5]POB15427.1 hydroxymethylglutaryl-CoA lyase [Halobacteriovorax sp. DA5]
MTKKIKIVEVGPRDGLQNEKSFVATEDKLEFIKLLSETGLSTIEVTSFVRPDKIPQMQDAAELYPQVLKITEDKGIATPCLVPNLKGLELAKSLGVKEISMFTATSNTFNQKNINATIEEAHARQIEVAKAALDEGMKVRGYLSTVFGCPYEKEIKDKSIVDGIQRLLDLGCYEISLGDTIGVANPNQVRRITKLIKDHFGLKQMAMHFHDTEGMALANIYASLEEGIEVFDSSAAGLGGCPYAKGASGNVATDDVVNLLHKLGFDTGVDMDKLHDASSFIISKIGHTAPSKFFQAYKGRK